MVIRGPTNRKMLELIAFLEISSKKNKAPVWARAAGLLLRPTRKRVEVNVSQMTKLTGTLLVPGKVLSNGVGTKATVAAFAFSGKAREKIAKAGGKAISITQLVESNPSGKNVLIIV